MEENVPQLLTVIEASKLIGVSRSTLDRIVARGLLAYYKIGKSKRFKISDIHTYFDRVRVESTVVVEDPKTGKREIVRRAKRRVLLKGSGDAMVEVEI